MADIKKCRSIRISVPRIIAAGIVYMIVSQIIHTLEAFGTMGYYLIPDYFQVWSKIMMPGMGPPGAEFYYYSFGFALVAGILFALVYALAGCCLPGSDMKRGAYYGFLIWLVAGIPSMLSLILLVNLPWDLVGIWTIIGLVVYLINGALAAKIVK